VQPLVMVYEHDIPSRARPRGSSLKATRLTPNGTPGGHCLTT